MINEGFKTTATKEDITRAEVRLDRIEYLLLAEQKHENEDLKLRMKRLERPHRLATRQKSPGHGGFWVTFQSGPLDYRLSGPLEPTSAHQHPYVMAGSPDRAQAPSLLNR